MRRDTRRTGFGLVLAGIAAGAFFWLTDPQCGLPTRSTNYMVEAINQAWPGTLVGIVGSFAIAVIGLWLTLRRTA